MLLANLIQDSEINLVNYFKVLHCYMLSCNLINSSNNTRLESGRTVRPSTTKMWKDSSKSKAASESISIDSARLWNCAPADIKNATTLSGAKREIKKFCKLLEF